MMVDGDNFSIKSQQLIFLTLDMKYKFNRKHMASQNALDNALGQLQAIFPTLALPRPLRHAQLHDSLNRICHSLPVPDAYSNQSALETMRQIIDQQEYRYQRSLLLQSERDNVRLFQEEECYYEQASTGILVKKETGFTSCEEGGKSDMVDDVWGWKEEKHDPQEYLLFID